VQQQILSLHLDATLLPQLAPEMAVGHGAATVGLGRAVMQRVCRCLVCCRPNSVGKHLVTKMIGKQ